jgi:Secretion system C-terminal sorting domain
MKTFMRSGALSKLRMLFISITILSYSTISSAQIVCDGTTVMYGMWNNFTALRNQVRSINFTTGAIGAAYGGATFNIPYTDVNTPASGYYGSTTLSASATSNRFYFMNRDYNRKSVWIMNGNTGGRNLLEDLTQNALNSNWFVKLAVGTDNRNYSLATPVKVASNRYLTMPTKMIRFPASTCTTNDCASGSVVDMGSILGSSSFWANYLYNGDIAFSTNGDMYLFGSELDTVTNKYGRSRIYRITAANIPATPNPANIIPIQYITDITGLGPGFGNDSVTITGAAFDLAGNFYISANDTAANWEASYLYRGSSIGGTSSAVTPIAGFSPIPAGYKITDLASCTYPNIQVLPHSAFKLSADKDGNVSTLIWEDKLSIESRYYLIERKLDSESDFREISTVDASEIQQDGKFHFKDDRLPSSYDVALYRIKSILVNGAYAYSNTTKITSDLSANSFKIKNNPFVDNIQMEITAGRTGKMDVALYTETGMLVMKRTIQVSKGKNQQYLTNLSHLKTGVYVLKASNENEQFIQRLVKQ